MLVDAVRLSQDDSGFTASLTYGISYHIEIQDAIDLAQDENTHFDDTIPNESMLALLLGDV